ncbi:hypothetical protein DFR70_108354 [Nocardia tenerifensis]|uniref:Uncharacterized protein n=1 Tax=Nocardia tenerifensis TaxID=228006 RepID=A0A318KKI9_9NOCA|nr:hypothetical protein DFR70_108354 [Nocardia tenerifensis]
MVVDQFYECLGARNWVFHDSLSLDRVEALLSETSDAASAEERLIDLYRDEEITQWWLSQIRKLDGMKHRWHQVERAREHYHAGQFDSCALHLIAVMDGFVNDFEPDVRKGLVSRDPEGMTVWDSIVGHHLGLTHVLKTFGKTFKKRIDHEVFDLFRHGIVHGSVVNFNNVVVATKAWNMLFAVADWSVATAKASKPVESKPSWGEVLSALERQKRYRQYKDDFQPSQIAAGDSGFDTDELVARTTQFLDAWQHGRWALVVPFMQPEGRGVSGRKAGAFQARELYQRYNLSSFQICTVSYTQASSAEVVADATVNGTKTRITFRMVLYTVDGFAGMPGEDGAEWRLAMSSPQQFFP